MRQRKQAKKHKQVDAKQWPETKDGGRREDGTKTIDSPSKIKKLLPSVKALKSQFESGPAPDAPRSRSKDKSPSPPKPTAERTPVAPPAERPRPTGVATGESAAAPRTVSPQRPAAPGPASAQAPPAKNGAGAKKVYIPDDPVEAIYDKFGEVDERLLKQRITTLSWDPTSLVSRLYEVPEPAHRPQGQEKGYINIEGWLEKLPSGRKKATFWNAWKRRYFKAKDGFLYYYQTNTTEKPSMVLQLMGGHVEAMDSSVVGVDDGKGRYVVVRCSSRQEAERWTRALLSHTVEDYNATYVQPVAVPASVAPARRCVVIDLGSSSIRAGVLHDQPALPQLFFPAVMVTSREGRQLTFGAAALRPEVRATGVLSFPLRPSSKITKYSVDVPALAGLLQLTFRELRVSPADYSVQLSLPRSFNTATLGEILRLLFDKFGAQGVNLTHQSILAMWSYNATSGVVVDVGDRMDVVPVIDGYIVEGGVSRVPYGGVRIQDHLRHFLLQKHYSLVTEVESLVVRLAMERLCFVSERYAADLQRFQADPASLEKSVSVKEFLGDSVSWRRITLDSGRFQAAEGLFTPEAWGLDNKGVHKLVHKAVQECSVDIRKEMVRSIYLAGGVTLLPGFAERLQAEMDKLTPPSVTPKVHASPYRYHAAYLGACVLAGSDGFQQAMVTRDSWLKLGVSALKKWTV
ncbi:actin-like isoform X2 [Pollicipes pollicipes]|uniref:actin-like isoform X2 n=1 Tax=Pollicipes pollicipes TaxID=41117 RepID=UPI00188524B5|nr:actin-like isoform X2 [Pollicipes pollicipes]